MVIVSKKLINKGVTVKKDIAINMIISLFLGMIMFIQNKYFIKYMGIEVLGIIKVFTELLQYLNIIEMGLGSASSFALYKPLIEKDYKKVSIILSTIRNIYIKIALSLFGIGVLFTPILKFFIKIEKFDSMIYCYWILFLLNTVSSYFFVKYIILFTANQEFILVRYIQGFSKIFYQLLQILSIFIFRSLMLYIFLLILDNLTQYFFLKKHYKKKYSFIYKTKEKYLDLKNDIKNLFWHKLAGLIVFNTDLILISKFTSLKIVGIYSSYQMILQFIIGVIGIVINVLRPKIGKFVSQHSKEEIYELFKISNILFLMIGILVSFCSYILINNFIDIWLGNKYRLSEVTIILILINLFIKIFRIIIETFKETSGFFDDIESPILEAIINFIFSIILGMKYGLNGIILGTIISNISIILIYKPILVFKRCFNKGVKEYIKIYGNYLFLLMISLFFLNVTIRFFRKVKIVTWIEWINHAILVSLVTGVILFIVFLLNKTFRKIIKVYMFQK